MSSGFFRVLAIPRRTTPARTAGAAMDARGKEVKVMGAVAMALARQGRDSGSCPYTADITRNDVCATRPLGFNPAGG